MFEVEVAAWYLSEVPRWYSHLETAEEFWEWQRDREFYLRRHGYKRDEVDCCYRDRARDSKQAPGTWPPKLVDIAPGPRQLV